ncbi:MAG: metallophosphoesterase [Clostridia bacterium]|nr:metallophosphoesterase [Clostridia bacterium]
MSIYVTGDTHRDDLLGIKDFCNNHPELTKKHYIIIAGDFGGVWDKTTLERDLKQFSDLPVTVLFVDGNHENFDLINSYPVEIWNGGKVHKIKPDIIHLMRGQVFEIEGKKIFTFGGATSIDRDYRIKGKSWWEQETPTYEELDEGIANLKRYDNQVDYIITHSCGQRALTYHQMRMVVGTKIWCPESHLLSNFEDIAKFKHWYFGHFHIDARLSYRFTVVYNKVIELK